MNKFWIWISGGLVILIWFGALITSLCRSQTFDLFNAVTTLFSGLGFVGLIATLIMQRQQFHADSRMNAIATILNNRESIAQVLNNDRRAKELEIDRDKVSNSNAKLYKELMKSLGEDIDLNI